MYHARSLYGTIVILLFSVVLTSGCGTLIGAGIGSLTDDSNDIDTTMHSAAYLYDIEQGAPVRLVLKSGEIHRGIFNGFSNPTIESLNEMLSVKQVTTTAPYTVQMLQCGDTVDILLTDGTAYPAVFLGVHTTGVYLYRPNELRHVCLAMLFLDEIVCRDGKRFDEASLIRALRREDFPPVTNLRLVTDNGMSLLPMKAIQGITTTSRSHAGRTWGMILGAACDIFIIASVANFQGHRFIF